MKSIKEIMSELGFNADAPLDTQKAFFKNLVAAANATAPFSQHKTQIIPTMVEKKASEPTPAPIKKQKTPVPEQLAFDFASINRVS